MSAKQAIVELQNLTKDYGYFRALDDVSLQIPTGVTGLLGPNGAGKSTLIKVLLGLLPASSGNGRLLDYQIGRQSREIRANVGYMPEDDCFLFGLTGIEAVQVSAQLSRIPKIEALRRAHEILDFCGAGQERYRTVETYSTGMRQKLRFAQALVHDPPFLILDEPTSGLDPEERDMMLLRIKQLAENHDKGILICTHILPDVQATCDWIIILSGGRVCVSDTLENLSQIENPAIEIRLKGDASSFAEQLSAAGLTTTRTQINTVWVQGVSESISKEIWKVANSSDIAIRSMTPSRNTLEDIFLAAVKERNVAIQ